MAQAGPIAAAVLSAIQGEGEVSGHAVLDSEHKLTTKDGEHKEHNKAITHHYKITKTQTVEIDDSVENKDEAEVENTNETGRHRRRGGFLSCFGKCTK